MPTLIKARVLASSGEWWSMAFALAPGGVLAPGTYTGATRYLFNDSGPRMYVVGNSRGCNELDGSFTVHELSFDGDTVRTLSVSFEQQCEHFEQALRGTLNFRAGNTTAPAPWMVPTAPPEVAGGPGAARRNHAASCRRRRSRFVRRRRAAAGGDRLADIVTAMGASVAVDYGVRSHRTAKLSALRAPRVFIVDGNLEPGLLVPSPRTRGRARRGVRRDCLR